MSDNLTELIPRVQALLGDPTGAVFSAAACTTAIRQALAEFNRAAPVLHGTLLDVVAGQKEYVLNEPEFEGMCAVYGVWLLGVNGYDILLPADMYYEDNAPAFRLRAAQGAGTLIIRYGLPNTVAGLDGEAESTLSKNQDGVLVNGACMHALRTRMISRVETVNLAPEVAENYLRVQAYFQELFHNGLRAFAWRGSAVGEVERLTWEDEYQWR